jgi:CHAT domain-containing protein/Tfp pilus assembly protein PilF
MTFRQRSEPCFPYARSPLCRYWLGELKDEEKREVEERSQVDENFKELLQETEPELVAAYVSGHLTRSKKEMFERHYLNSEERLKKLHLAEALYDAARLRDPGDQTFETHFLRFDAGTEDLKFVQVVSEYYGYVGCLEDREVGDVRWLDRLQQRLAQPITVSMARPTWHLLTAVAVIGFGALVWSSLFYQSAETRALNALHSAYAQERPVEARLTDFAYASYHARQNGDAIAYDRQKRDKAFELIIDQVLEEKTPQAYHALGKIYLTDRDFNEAIKCFETALQNNADDARLRNDLGVALMERGKRKNPGQSAADDFAEASKHLHRAVELAPSLLEARFNLSLCHQYQSLWRTAEEGWKNYLEKDSSSPWAEEARKNLEKVTERIKRGGDDREKARQDFLDAYHRGDVEQAWLAYKRSRQTATGSFIAESLLNKYLSLALSGKSAEAGESLSALRFIGDLEIERVEDRFSYDLSKFYSGATPEQLRKISAARELAATANARFGQSRLDDAINGYRRAVELFDEAGDVCESLMARRRLGHCYFRQSSPTLSSPLLMQGRLECETRGYLWLLGMFLNELANTNTYLTKYSTALDYGLAQVSNAKRIKDDYGVLRGIIRVAEIYALLARRDETLQMVQEGLSVAGAINTDPGQLIGLYTLASKSYIASGKFVAALDYEKEAFKLSLQSNNPWLVSGHYAHLGLAHYKLGQPSEAIKLMRQGVEMGERLPDRKMGAEIMAFSHIRLGEVYREIGDLDSSVKSYRDAIRLCGENQVDNQWLGFEAKKGMLLSHIKRGDDAAAEEALKEVMELYERFRDNIEDENSRNNFFDNEQGVYDIAIEYAFTRQDPRRAFEFSEMSRARSLFDAVNLPPGKLLDENLPSVRLPRSTQPLDLSQIQSRLPGKTQLLQYSVLDKRTVIWTMSGADFKSRSVEVGREEIDKKVSDYLRSLAGGPDAALGNDYRGRSSELYGLLIKPVEDLLGKEICIIPDKALNRLPFASLISPTTGKYLIEERTIFTSPSANMFVVASDKARQKEGVQTERLLSVGNPSFDRATFPNLKDLPWAATQASAISAFYRSAEVLLEGAAKESTVRKVIERSDVAHFATHYVPDERSPMLSVLPLAGEGNPSSRENDGVLQTFEFYNMNLSRLRLVVLSACQTGIERYYKGEGAIGLARAFQAAGIPLVVASSWPVESYPTKELMIAFHKHRKSDGLSTTQALRQAQLDMIRSGSPELRNPYNWAAYTVIGGQAAF